MTPLRQQMSDAMVLRGFARVLRKPTWLQSWHLPSITGARPTPSCAEQLQAYLLHLITREEARLLERQSGLLRFPLPVWQRAAPSRCALRHPHGQGAQTPAADPLARRGQRA